MTSDINSLFTSIQSTLFLLNITKHSSQNSFNSENLHLLYKKLIKKLSVNLPRLVQPSANIVGTHIKQRLRTPLDSPCSSKICFYLILLVISILKHKGWNPSYLSCDWLTKNSVRGHELPARASLRREATSEVFSLSVSIKESHYYPKYIVLRYPRSFWPHVFRGFFKVVWDIC